MSKIAGVPPQTGDPGGSAPDPVRPNEQELAAVQALLHSIPMAAAAHTMDYRLIAANTECAVLLKLDLDQAAGRPVRDFIPQLDRADALGIARGVVATSAARPRSASALRRLIDGDGQELTCWLHVGLAVVAGYQCFIACIDLVNPVLSEAHRWRHRAEHDELTGLRRRGSLLAQVSRWIDTGETVVLAFLDVDDFKAINDTYGHAAGDHVLSTLGRRLEQYAPPGCLVGRLSGDEFVLADLRSARGDRSPAGGAATGATADAAGTGTADAVATDVAGDRTAGGAAGGATAATAGGAAGEVLRTVALRCESEAIAWGDHRLMVSLTVGIAVNAEGDDTAALLAKADDAMYANKTRRGRSR